MLNRQQRRKVEKKTRKKLTDEQFNKLFRKSNSEAMAAVVEDKVSRIWEIMSKELIDIMRENHISLERINKITSEFMDRMQMKYGEVNGNEGLPE